MSAAGEWFAWHAPNYKAVEVAIMPRSLLLAVATALVCSGCVDDRFFEAATVGDADVRIVMDGPEALEWLKANKNESALASNRFLGTENAVKFVRALYAAGATKVMVPTDTIRSDSDTMRTEGGPYADALVVNVPKDPGARSAVMQICRAELRREGFDSEDVESADQVYLWWD